MDKCKIWNFINSYAKSNVKSRRNLFKGPTLYWAVLKDDDFKRRQHKNFPRICETQVYVGKAKEGIRRRWLIEGNNHCRNMFRVLGGEKHSLVDTRLLLANLRKDEHWCIFAMAVKNEHLVKEETKHIAGQLSTKVMNDTVYGKWTPLNVKYGLNMSGKEQETAKMSALERLKEDSVDYKHLSKVNGKFKWSKKFDSFKRFVDAVSETDTVWNEVMSFRNSYVHIEFGQDGELHISGDKKKSYGRLL